MWILNNTLKLLCIFKPVAWYCLWLFLRSITYNLHILWKGDQTNTPCRMNLSHLFKLLINSCLNTLQPWHECIPTPSCIHHILLKLLSKIPLHLFQFFHWVIFKFYFSLRILTRLGFKSWRVYFYNSRSKSKNCFCYRKRNKTMCH